MTKAKLVELKGEELPENWVASTLGEVASYIQRGKSPKYTEYSELPVVNQKCVRWHGIDREHVKYIHPDQFSKWEEKRFLQNGDLLWNSTGTGTIGRAAIVHLKDGERLVSDSHVTIVRSAEGMEPKYVHYWVMGPAVQNSIEVMQSGSTNQVELSKGAVESTPIPVAPPEQQKRIVAKIEELFSHIDAGIEALRKAKQLLKQYRQSVLKAAVTGELTKDWREQNKDKLEPASKLLERILTERRQKWEEQQLEQFKAKGKIPKNDRWKDKYEVPSVVACHVDVVDESWLKVNLGILKFYSIYGPRFSSNDYSDDGVIVLRTTDMDERGRVKVENAPKLDLADSDYDRYRVERGDLLITRTGSIGTLAIFQDDCRAIPGAYLLHYKFTQEQVKPSYIYMVFKSPEIQKTLTGSTQGIGRPNLNAPTLESIQFNLPSVEEQTVIAGMVDEKLSSINRLEEELENKFIQAEKNKQSILASAFSGELVEGLVTDGSAKDLLASIKAKKVIDNAKAKVPGKRVPSKKKVSNVEKKAILTVLKESEEPLSPEKLFDLTGRDGESPDDIEQFYVELKQTLEDKDVLVEAVLEKGVKNGDVISYKVEV